MCLLDVALASTVRDGRDGLCGAHLSATSNFRLKIRIDIVSDRTCSTAKKPEAIDNLTVTDRRLAQTAPPHRRLPPTHAPLMFCIPFDGIHLKEPNG